MNALSRMIDRRRCSREIVTDNGTNFIKAEKEIKCLMLKDEDKLNGFPQNFK